MTPLQLSQSALSSFARCRRRFYLRFVRRLEWPAPLTGSEQDWERSLRRGEELHLFIQQAALGMDVDDLVREAGDDQLARWWDSVVEYPPPQPDGKIHTEIELMVPLGIPLGAHRLVARFDRLIVVDAEAGPRIHIVDWKTGKPMPASRLERSWQTTVYRFVAVEASAQLTSSGSQVPPAHIGFTYWQAEAPETPLRFAYDEAAHEAGRERITAAVGDIEQRLSDGEDGFERTTDLEACRHCPYRSYCDRGRESPPGLDVDDDFEDGEDGFALAEENSV
jgi:CRISPR/Cas system-associated exonuclease Cas4 (RecB family)